MLIIFMVKRKIAELEEELKVVGNNMRSLEIAEQEVITRSRLDCCFNALLNQTFALLQ